MSNISRPMNCSFSKSVSAASEAEDGEDGDFDSTAPPLSVHEQEFAQVDGDESPTVFDDDEFEK